MYQKSTDHRGYKIEKISFARILRKRMTVPEKILWHMLRDRRFWKLKFRRQVPMGPYIVDFICFEKKLILEVDGAFHMRRQKEDAVRTEYLNQKGYRVVRFGNQEILRALPNVMKRILL